MNKEMDRRQFLWKAAAGIAGYTVADVLLPNTTHAQQEEPTIEQVVVALSSVNQNSIKRDVDLLYWLNETRDNAKLSRIMPGEDGNLHEVEKGKTEPANNNSDRPQA